MNVGYHSIGNLTRIDEEVEQALQRWQRISFLILKIWVPKPLRKTVITSCITGTAPSIYNSRNLCVLSTSSLALCPVYNFRNLCVCTTNYIMGTMHALCIYSQESVCEFVCFTGILRNHRHCALVYLNSRTSHVVAFGASLLPLWVWKEPFLFLCFSLSAISSLPLPLCFSLSHFLSHSVSSWHFTKGSSFC